MKNKGNGGSAKAKFIGILTAIMLVATVLAPAILLAACDPDVRLPSNYDANAKLKFEDDFSGNAIDLTKWKVHGSGITDNPGELRRGGWWTEDSVYVKDGNLVINTTYDPENDTFYTGAVDAVQYMAYGFYEARCKLPEACAIWSAFWIMSDEMGLEEPDSSIGGAEIDIFESPYYKFNNGVIQHAIHTAGYGSKTNESTCFPVGLERFDGVSNAYEAWHTFALDWQPEAYTFYVDGKMTWTTTDPYNKNGIKIENNVSPLPAYMMLSVEVGGENAVPGNMPFIFGGRHPIRNNQNMYDMNNFSVDFLIDYVRVWEKNPYVE